jgi:hypothetical protein
MASANSNAALRVTELDFTSIRENLKEYLRSQDTFQDYDFEGSGLAVLLDMLAYNTYYNAFYMNMLANESFLDTAQIRQNILSHSKAIGYVPASARGSQAVIDVYVKPTRNEITTIPTITLEKYTRLLGTDVNGINYPFVTVNSNTVTKFASAFTFSNVVIKQGEAITQQFKVDASNPYRRFELPSANVDTSTLTVLVFESSSNSYSEEYSLANDLTELSPDSFVYFVEENENLNWTVYFGDGVLGYKPKNGNIVQITYLDTTGAAANNIGGFKFVQPVGGYYREDVRVTTRQASRGAVDKEDIETIRIRAPNFYTAQNRAVTTTDYESTLVKNYPNIDAVSVWGGEDNVPIQYGKVFMSFKTKGYYKLSDQDKEIIKRDYVRNKNVVTVTPEIVDPDYVFVVLTGRVTYDPNRTSKTANEIREIVRAAILKYNNDELNTFKSTFRKSKLQQYIEGSDPAITGSDIDVYVQKRVDMIVDELRRYIINYNMPLMKSDAYNRFNSYPWIKVIDTALNQRNVYFEEDPGANSGINSVTMINGGDGYTELPKVTITGDGVGATATAVVVDEKVIKINVTNKGRNYTRAQVQITGLGEGAAAVPVLETNLGTVRTYYTTSTGDQVIVDNNAGTIYYDRGQVVLNYIRPVDVANNSFYDTDVVSFSAVPAQEIIKPSRNRILAIDVDNPQSIQFDVIAET